MSNPIPEQEDPIGTFAGDCPLEVQTGHSRGVERSFSALEEITFEYGVVAGKGREANKTAV